MTYVSHPFSPIYNESSKILILGTLPSVKSRENNFYYGHPQNRFWKLIARLCNYPLPVTVEEKTALLLDNNFAIWDVIESCDIQGSSDSSIKNVTPTDVYGLLKKTNITHIYANGTTAKKLYDKHTLPLTGVPIICLPSTSPANAVFTLDRLVEAWSIINISTLP